MVVSTFVTRVTIFLFINFLASLTLKEIMQEEGTWFWQPAQCIHCMSYINRTLYVVSNGSHNPKHVECFFITESEYQKMR